MTDKYDALIRKKFHEMHVKMWTWMADEGAKKRRCISKEEAFEHFGWNHNVNPSFCWMCRYFVWKSFYDFNRKSNCINTCMLDWGKDNNGNNMYCLSSGSVFEMWKEYYISNDWLGASICARKIANLPLKKSSYINNTCELYGCIYNNDGECEYKNATIQNPYYQACYESDFYPEE